jgi:hypothetical protein
MDNQHKKIKDYRDLTQEEIDLMYEAKELQERVGAFWNKLATTPGIDYRWLEIGRTDLQKGFMAAIRAIAKPESF